MTTANSSAGGPQEYYTSEPVQDSYVGDVARGLTDREQRLVDAYFERGDRVLDLGCGGGRTTGPLVERGLDVVGSDLAAGLVAAASDRCRNVPFAVCDASQLCFADETFDHVLFSYNGLDYVDTKPDRRRALDEVRRVLKPGGTFVFSSHNSRFHLFPDGISPGRLKQFAAFWLKNLRAGTATGPYWLEAHRHGSVRTHHATPAEHRRELRNAGFEVLETVGRDAPLAEYLGAYQYYVATKPREA